MRIDTVTCKHCDGVFSPLDLYEIGLKSLCPNCRTLLAFDGKYEETAKRERQDVSALIRELATARLALQKCREQLPKDDSTND